MAERLRSSLPPLKDIWKVGNSFSFAPYVKKGVDYSVEKVQQHSYLAATDLSEILRSSLPPLEDIWKVGNSFSFAPYVKKGVDYSVEKVQQHSYLAATDLSETLRSSLPPLGDIWKLMKEKVGDTFSSTWEKVKQVVEYAEDGVNAIAPYVKKAVAYLVEMVQQHPYLAGLIALILFLVHMWKCCGGSGGRLGGKMMKAPGANYRMPRAHFESSPKSYFRELRRKSA